MQTIAKGLEKLSDLVGGVDQKIKEDLKAMAKGKVSIEGDMKLIVSSLESCRSLFTSSHLLEKPQSEALSSAIGAINLQLPSAQVLDNLHADGAKKVLRDGGLIDFKLPLSSQPQVHLEGLKSVLDKWLRDHHSITKKYEPVSVFEKAITYFDHYIQQPTRLGEKTEITMGINGKNITRVLPMDSSELGRMNELGKCNLITKKIRKSSAASQGKP